MLAKNRSLSSSQTQGANGRWGWGPCPGERVLGCPSTDAPRTTLRMALAGAMRRCLSAVGAFLGVGAMRSALDRWGWAWRRAGQSVGWDGTASWAPFALTCCASDLLLGRVALGRCFGPCYARSAAGDHRSESMLRYRSRVPTSRWQIHRPPNRTSPNRRHP